MAKLSELLTEAEKEKFLEQQKHFTARFYLLNLKSILYESMERTKK